MPKLWFWGPAPSTRSPRQMRLIDKLKDMQARHRKVSHALTELSKIHGDFGKFTADLLSDRIQQNDFNVLAEVFRLKTRKDGNPVLAFAKIVFEPLDRLSFQRASKLARKLDPKRIARKFLRPD